MSWILQGTFYSLFASLARSAYDSNVTLPNRTVFAGYRTITHGSEKDGVSFIEFIAPDNFTILAIRGKLKSNPVGTFSLNDAFQDLYLWSTPVLLQLSSYMGTLVNVWPLETVSAFIWFVSRFGREGVILDFWRQVEKRAVEILEQDRDLVITGHSLGGAIAGIVGAHIDVPVVSFSAPGLAYQSM